MHQECIIFGFCKNIPKEVTDEYGEKTTTYVPHVWSMTIHTSAYLHIQHCVSALRCRDKNLLGDLVKLSGVFQPSDFVDASPSDGSSDGSKGKNQPLQKGTSLLHRQE